ncbi:MAG: hypothetical protein JXO22_08585 [Phycisphaerae bacterium]|nr:hypothetical protein [Phycisphaerae bacterium]
MRSTEPDAPSGEIEHPRSSAVRWIVTVMAFLAVAFLWGPAPKSEPGPSHQTLLNPVALLWHAMCVVVVYWACPRRKVGWVLIGLILLGSAATEVHLRLTEW